MRYDFKAEGWPSDHDEAVVRNAAVFHALAQRGVAHHVALMVAEKLERGDIVEGVEIELVFAHGELEAQMKELAITATWKGGEPRKPFTADMRPTGQRHPWTKAIRSAIKNWGRPEDEAEAITKRIEGGETVEGVELRWVTTELEEPVVDQFENYGVLMMKAGEPMPAEFVQEPLAQIWELTLAGDIREVRSILAIRCLKLWGARLGIAKGAVEAAMEGKVASVEIPATDDEDALVREMCRFGIAVRKTDG